MQTRRVTFLLFLCTALILLGTVSAPSALAEDRWYVFDEKHIPDDLGFLVSDYTGTVHITFLGDCTLGGESRLRGSRYGFVQTVKEKGYGWPFRNLTALTAGDDLTVANLEGVLSDRDTLEREDKKYNFLGQADYTEILKQGSVECVTLANNHSHDYGEQGYRDTKENIAKAGIASFGTDHMAVWERDGLLIGFTGVNYSASGNYGKRLEKQIGILRDLGCAAVITVIHTGDEHTQEINERQRQAAAKAIESGADLVVGHHPHVIQGMTVTDGVPVVYSLGNCVFGGTMYPDDSDALVLRADLDFKDNALTGITLRFFPISYSGRKDRNDYSPVFLEGDDAARALGKMEISTGYTMPPFSSGSGSAVTLPAVNGIPSETDDIVNHTHILL